MAIDLTGVDEPSRRHHAVQTISNACSRAATSHRVRETGLATYSRPERDPIQLDPRRCMPRFDKCTVKLHFFDSYRLLRGSARLLIDHELSGCPRPSSSCRPRSVVARRFRALRPGSHLPVRCARGGHPPGRGSARAVVPPPCRAVRRVARAADARRLRRGARAGRLSPCARSGDVERPLRVLRRLRGRPTRPAGQSTALAPSTGVAATRTASS